MKIFIVIQSFFICLFSLFTIEAQEMCKKETDLIIKNEEKLQNLFNWRSTHQLNQKNFKVSLAGLDQLRASGSSQFTQITLPQILKNIPATSKHLTVVDLREECHGFIDTLPITWISPSANSIFHPHHLNHLGELEERSLMQEAVESNETLTSLCLPKDESVVVVTERELVEAVGANYLRLPVTDRHCPPSYIVDYFVEMIKSLDSGKWLHFHCRAGRGRTTTFLVMYDMMVNHQTVSMETIIRRHHDLGGNNLFDINKKDPCIQQASIERLHMVKQFYAYCHACPDFNISWSDWLKTQSF